MKNSLSCAIGAAAGLCSAVSLPSLADEAGSTSLQPVLVTATRTAQSADATLASVTVITREDIERQQPLSVQEALRGVPGLNIGNNGGLGKTTSVFMRGTNADHVLVLIDGVRSSSATSGTAAFEHIPIDQIERIEVVRGPRASLYGSDAIGGVIQIFTRKGGDGTKPFFSAGVGSYDTYKVSGGVSGGGERGWYNLSGGELYSHGINACRSSDSAGCFTHEPDKDGYENTSGSARAGYRFDNGVEVEGNLLQAEGTSKYDGTFLNNAKASQQVIGGKLRFAPLSDWDVTLRTGSSKDFSDNYLEKQFKSRFNTTRVSVSLQNDIAFAKNHLVSAGFDYYQDRVDSTVEYAANSRANKAGFLQYQAGVFGHDFILAARHDDNEQFGGHTTGSVGWGYGFGEPLRLTASWGNAFKAPSFNQLYFPGFGSPNVKPEQSESYEVGANGSLAGVHWSVNGYHTRIEDLITFDPKTRRAANIAKAEILGMEAGLATQVLGFDVAANLSLLDPLNQGMGTNHGNLLPRRAQQMARFDLDRSFGKFRFGLSVNQEGRRFDDLANQTRLAGFTTLDLRAAYEFYKDWTLEGRVSNLLDERYETAYLYNQPGLNGFLLLNYRPGATRL